eukprot:tig00020538_g10318.t1
MTLTGWLTGAFAGFCLQAYSNAIRRLPISRHPWEHVAFFVAGGFVGEKIEAWEAEAKEEGFRRQREFLAEQAAKGIVSRPVKFD